MEPVTTAKGAVTLGNLAYRIGKNYFEGARERRLQAAVADLFAAVDHEVPGQTPEGFEQALTNASDEVQHAFWAVVNEYVNAVEPEAQQYLAKLGAFYLQRNLPRDRFVVRMSRVLGEAFAEDLQALREFVAVLEWARGAEAPDAFYSRVGFHLFDNGLTFSMFETRAEFYKSYSVQGGRKGAIGAAGGLLVRARLITKNRDSIVFSAGHNPEHLKQLAVLFADPELSSSVEAVEEGAAPVAPRP